MGRYIGLIINKGKGGGGLGPTEPFTRSSGITTDGNNNVTAVTLLLALVVMPDDLVKGSVGPSPPPPLPLLIIKPTYLPMLYTSILPVLNHRH